MQNISLTFIIMLLAAHFSSSSGQQRAVFFDTLAVQTNQGFPSSLFETIRDKDSLNKFFVKINYDTLQAKKSPDFNSEMVIAVTTAFFDGDLRNVEYYHKIDSITEEENAIVVNIHRDSLAYSSKVQHSYSALLVTIPRFDKPATFRIDNPSAVRCSGKHNHKSISVTYSSLNAMKHYTINGRFLRHDKINSKHFLVSQRAYDCNKAFFFQ